MWALATGTAPVSGFTYSFYVNGVFIGNALQPTPADYRVNLGIAWTPPQPGVYFLSCTATDGLGHSATSIPVQFTATGISIVSPLPSTNLPIGSSVVIQAATAVNFGAISKVEFYDESGLLGSSRTFPYSIIYTPAATNPVTGLNVHFIHAKSYKADGTVAFLTPNQGLLMVNPVNPLPSCSVSTPQGTPATPSTIAIPDYVASPSAFIPVIIDASSPQGNIQQVQLYINGVLYGTNANYPYSFKWTPTVTGLYDLTALAYDDKNNVIASTTSTTATVTPSPTVVIVGSLPSVAITSPANGATISGAGTGTATVTVSATDTNTDSLGNPIAIKVVQVSQDGAVVGSATTPITPGGNLYAITFQPKQNLDPVSGKPIASVFTAFATDTLGFTGTSANLSVTVDTGGSSSSVTVGTPPTISLLAPTDNSTVVVKTNVTLSATAAATNTPGNVSKVVFNVDNTAVATVTSYPYNATWQPLNTGTYQISAQVTDNNGNTANSSKVLVYVKDQPPPVVSITSPLTGNSATVSSGVTINASATSPAGTIASVQFFENNISIGTSSAPPYTATFTPLSEGLYTLTAIATDSAGEVTTSAPVIVEALPSTSGLGTTTYFGQYQGVGTSTGRFAYIVIDGTYGTFIGHSSSGVAFNSGLSVSSAGNFSTNALNGSASVTGVSGTLNPNQLFIGAATQAGSITVATGYYSGTVSGQSSTQVTGIVGADGEVMIYLASGGTKDVADGSIDSDGNFTITTALGNTFTGKLDSKHGLLSGAISGSINGPVLAAKVSGGLFSDGALSNISTRGPVASGANAMITGFVVGGSASKQLLIRAAGPALTAFGLAGAVSATQLQVYDSKSTLVASNTGWDSDPVNATAVSNAQTQTGAFAFKAGAKDSALVGTFVPGSYTAQVTGVSGATGIALAEVYDLDGYSPFSSKKLINLSTRGNVSSGASVMIGGIVVNGTAPKKLLIRAAGPSLTALGVSGALANPHLQLFDSNQNLVRDNYAWEVGNDATLVTAAAKKSGAFSFASGSADSAILIVLPPGTYTAEVSGATSSSTGIALIEVYEVP